MEERPKYPPSPEDDDDDEDDKEKLRKKRSFIAQFIEDNAKSEQEEEKKEKISLDIAKSLFEKDQDLNEEQDADDEGIQKPESELTTIEEEEAISIGNEGIAEGPAELSPEEEIYVNREIAERHLEEPVIEEEPAPTVTEFLEMIVDGIKPNEAYSTTIKENNLEEPESTSMEPEPATVPVMSAPEVVAESIITSIAPPRVETSMSSQPKGHEPTPQLTSTIVAPAHPEIKTQSKKEKAVAPVLTDYLIGKRIGKKSAKAEAAPIRRRLETKVQEMEQKLTNQEATIQKLTKENKLRMRQIAPEARTQSTVESSRLDLTKPERVERIGKVVIVAAEAPKTPPTKERVLTTSNIRKLVKPEEIKTMRRQELLAVSDKIRIEGASLKDMFENNLFSERALRRLVEHYLKGKDIRAELRREIVEREIDFERDPILRDRSRDDRLTIKNPSLFEHMLKAVEVPDAAGADSGRAIKENNPKEKTASQPSLGTKTDKKTAAVPEKLKQPVQAQHSLAGSVLSMIIVLLVLVIIYLLLVRH